MSYRLMDCDRHGVGVHAWVASCLSLMLRLLDVKCENSFAGVIAERTNACACSEPNSALTLKQRRRCRTRPQKCVRLFACCWHLIHVRPRLVCAE